MNEQISFKMVKTNATESGLIFEYMTKESCYNCKHSRPNRDAEKWHLLSCTQHHKDVQRDHLCAAYVNKPPRSEMTGDGGITTYGEAKQIKE